MRTFLAERNPLYTSPIKKCFLNSNLIQNSLKDLLALNFGFSEYFAGCLNPMLQNDGSTCSFYLTQHNVNISKYTVLMLRLMGQKQAREDVTSSHLQRLCLDWAVKVLINISILHPVIQKDRRVFEYVVFQRSSVIHFQQKNRLRQ